MKEETSEHPQPFLLPSVKRRTKLYPDRSFNRKGMCLEERANYKFAARYEEFQGILKRVSEMKLDGSLDSEEPSTESEKSESSHRKRRARSKCSSLDEPSYVSYFEDESSLSSVTGSDHCLPYEEIPVESRIVCTCTRLPPYPDYSGVSLSSFRESLPPPPSPTEIRTEVPDLRPQEYKPEERQSFQEQEAKTTDDNFGFDSCTELDERGVSLEDRQPEGITEKEKHQLEVFFKGLRTEVFVCGCLANLYVGRKEKEENWTYKHTGAVVVVFDNGDARSRSKKKIQIVLAERGTCFPLWKDTIDNLSAYHKSGTAFHTMYLSSDHRQMIGFSFDSPAESDKLLKHLEGLTSNPENINISVPGSKKRKVPRKKPVPLPHKKNISNPCLFQHVTSVAAKDRPIYVSLQTLVDGEVRKENIS